MGKDNCRYTGLYLNTLGVAQFRAGQIQKALATLTRADQLNTKDNDGSIPADLAFLAMAQYRLGQRDQARATLDHLHERMKLPGWAKNQEYRDFQAEAEALILGQDKATKKIPKID